MQHLLLGPLIYLRCDLPLVQQPAQRLELGLRTRRLHMLAREEQPERSAQTRRARRVRKRRARLAQHTACNHGLLLASGDWERVQINPLGQLASPNYLISLTFRIHQRRQRQHPLSRLSTARKHM